MTNSIDNQNTPVQESSENQNDPVAQSFKEIFFLFFQSMLNKCNNVQIFIAFVIFVGIALHPATYEIPIVREWLGLEKVGEIKKIGGRKDDLKAQDVRDSKTCELSDYGNVEVSMNAHDLDRAFKTVGSVFKFDGNKVHQRWVLDEVVIEGVFVEGKLMTIEIKECF